MFNLMKRMRTVGGVLDGEIATSKARALRSGGAMHYTRIGILEEIRYLLEIAQVLDERGRAKEVPEIAFTEKDIEKFFAEGNFRTVEEVKKAMMKGLE